MKSHSEAKHQRKTGQLACKVSTRKSWCDIETNYPPSSVLAICDKAEVDVFSLDAKGKQAINRRNARTIAALIEFTDLRVVDCARLVKIKRDGAWWLRRKWTDLPQEQRSSWLGYIHARLK